MRSFMKVLAMTLICASGYSATVYVPDNYATIQEAIDASFNGDTVIVRPGSYVEKIDFVGKAIIVQSEHGANVTTIDGNQAGSVVTCQSGEAADSVLDGFTVTNGSGTDVGGWFYGGGMYNVLSHPTVTNCTFYNNSTRYGGYHGSGGGMYNQESNPAVTNCVFSENETYTNGGGICNIQSNPTLNNCTFSGNESVGGGGAGYPGGGMYNYSSSPTVCDCTFTSNTADCGGGIWNEEGSSPTVTNCTFSGNTRRAISNEVNSNSTIKNCTFSGNTGGMSNYQSSPTVDSCTFTENFDGDGFSGGGMRNSDSNPTVTNCDFKGNWATSGGGMCNHHSSPIVTNCSFSENGAVGFIYSAGAGGGMRNYFYSNPKVTNCTFFNNTATGHQGGIGGGIFNDGGDLMVTNCVFSGNSAYFGGGMIDSCGNPTMTNCIFYNNSADYEGGGICCLTSSSTITNTILWDNDAPTGPEIWMGAANLTISYSDVDGGQSSCYVDPGSTLNWGTGMIDANPLFVDAPNGDFHLTCLSPCYGAGDNSAQSLPSVDFEGDPRVIHDNVEIGADEFFCHLYYVGSPVPGDVLGARVAAIPGQEVTLYRGNDVLETPYWTGRGYLYITWPAATSWYLGNIPNTGVLKLNVTVPHNWNPGETYPFQAQVGQWGNAYSWLTNLVALTVE